MTDIPAWSELRGSIDAGLRTAVSTTVRVTVTDPDGGHRSWFLGNERPAWLNVTSGDYHLIRDGDRIRLTELSENGDDGVPRILSDGSRTVFFTGTGPVDASAGPRFITSPLGVLLEKENLATLLDSLFPSGPVTRGHHDSRDAWIVPGDDGRTLVVDCSTGVVLGLTGPTGTASLRDPVFPTSPVDDTEFTWTGTAEPPPRISDLFPTSHGESSDGDDPAALDAEFSGRLRDMTVPEGAATTSAPADPVPPHLLTYSRSAWRYEDDGGPDHRLGDTAEVRLRFIESDEPPLPALLSEVTAFAEPASGVVRRDRDSGSTGHGYRWPTRLTGHGWSADWDAPRPATGFLRLRGWFFDDDACSHRSSPVRGRVDRLTLVSPKGTGEPDTVDVDRISLPFPYQETRDHGYRRGISEVLVTVNLDHGAPPEITDGIRMTRRGQCVPGDGFLWLPDAELPVVWRHDIRTRTTSPVLLPLTVPATAHRLSTVYLDGGDCCLRYGWRTDRYDDPDSGQPDGTFRLRITPEGSVSSIDRDGDPEQELLLTPKERDTVSVQLSTDLTAEDIESPHKADRHPDGGWYTSQWVWLSHGRQPGPTGVLQLGRLHPDGSFTVLRREFSHSGIRIDSDLVVSGRSVVRWNRSTLTRFSPGLEVLQRVHSTAMIDDVNRAGRYLVVAVDTPTRGDDSFGDSILDHIIAPTCEPGEAVEPGSEPEPERGSGMIVVVDPETLEPLVSLTRATRWPHATVVATTESGGGEKYFLVDDDLVEINRGADGLWNARVIAGFRGVSAF